MSEIAVGWGWRVMEFGAKKNTAKIGKAKKPFDKDNNHIRVSYPFQQQIYLPSSHKFVQSYQLAYHE